MLDHQNHLDDSRVQPRLKPTGIWVEPRPLMSRPGFFLFYQVPVGVLGSWLKLRHARLASSFGFLGPGSGGDRQPSQSAAGKGWFKWLIRPGHSTWSLEYS